MLYIRVMDYILYSKSYMHLKKKTDLKFGTKLVRCLLLNDINNHFSLHHDTQDIEFARLKNRNCSNITM